MLNIVMSQSLFKDSFFILPFVITFCTCNLVLLCLFVLKSKAHHVLSTVLAFIVMVYDTFVVKTI